MIYRPQNIEKDFEIVCDVVIVGAGPGGSAAAHKLSKAGKKVVVLEMGGFFNPSEFTRDALKSLKNLYQDAGQRVAVGNAFVPVMFGKGVGGGTLVNSGISFRPPAKALKRWSEESGISSLSISGLENYLKEVEENVNIEILSLDRLGRNNTIFKDGLERLNYKGNVIPRNTKNCIGCASCFFGCPSGAKQSTDKNFIQTALSNGADVYTYAKVTKIETNESKKKILSLTGVILDPETETEKFKFSVKAKHYIIASGAIGTPMLLLNNQIANSSGQVGKNFRCHPTTGVVGEFDEVINGHKSVVQGYYCDQFGDEELLIETVWAPLSVFATFSAGYGDTTLKIMQKFKHFASAGAMIRDESVGEVTFDGEEAKIRYQITERDQILLTKGFYRTSEILFAAGAHTVLGDNPFKPVFKSMSELHDFFKNTPNMGPDIVREGNHGLGTCRMGANPKNSVVNEFGKSHDVDNLWLTDVSTFPSALGVNPQITIMALALRSAEHLAGQI